MNPTLVANSQTQQLLDEVWQCMRSELAKHGLPDALASQREAFVAIQARKDPYDGSETHYHEWRCRNGRLLGHLQLTTAGTVYAEYDLLTPHPQKPQWVIEAVTAWGRKGAVKTELKLLTAAE